MISGSRLTTMRHALTATAITTLARWTPYLESEMCALRTLIRPGSVCIDVGSAANLYTSVLSRLAGSAGQVHSIESLPFAHALWARFLTPPHADNVRHHGVALGTEAGSASMRVPFGRYGLITGRSYLERDCGGPDPNDEFGGQIPVTVPVERLDDLCAREAIDRIDFVKIDVEGAELQVLKGGRKVIAAHRPLMLASAPIRRKPGSTATPLRRQAHLPAAAQWLLPGGTGRLIGDRAEDDCPARQPGDRWSRRTSAKTQG